MKLHRHVYNRNEGAGPWWKTAQWSLSATLGDPEKGRYLGRIAKGWWKFGKSEITNYFEISVALGGEDSMAQFELVLPFLGRFAVGVGVPRSWCGWCYHRREWTVRIGYIGRWFELLVASDEHMRDCGMVSYYREKRANGTYDGPWSRLATWPGWHLTIRPRLVDRLLGRKICTTTTGATEQAVVPMPEGNYPATITREDRVWKRKRWPWPSNVRADYSIEIPSGIPVPGKGENSWDCDDDAVYGTGGKTPHEAVANATRAALRQRANYGSADWEPRRGWPEAVSR